MSALNGQAAEAVSQHADYVTVEMGANDACTSSQSTMTPVATFQSEFQQALTTLTTGRPNALISVNSIPDIGHLWTVAHDNAAAQTVWANAGICQSMLANPESMASADVTRRAAVEQRVVDFNTALATVCASFANCKFDGNAVFDTQFTISQLTSIDYFHPSIEGQSGLAAVTWAAGFGW
jgi:lysophospholipase L1-like esterase